jgi:hypothetical protein
LTPIRNGSIPIAPIKQKLGVRIGAATECSADTDVDFTASTHTTNLPRTTLSTVCAGSKASARRLAIDAETSPFRRACADAGTSRPTGAESITCFARAAIARAGAVIASSR